MRLWNILILCIILLCLHACRDSHGTHLEEIDTRPIVKAAYDSIDITKVGVIFNNKKAARLQSLFTAEKEPIRKLNYGIEAAIQHLYTGNTEEAIRAFRKITDFVFEHNLAKDSVSNRTLFSLLGIAYMRYGEIENCVKNHNHESCFLPIKGEGIHTLPFGSQSAILHYESGLSYFKNDLESIYLLNLAYMTLGQYPEKVPAQYLLPPQWFESKVKMQAFEEIAGKLGIARRSHAGGCVMEDINRDGWIDIVVTDWMPDGTLALYINNDDGSFTDQTKAYGLDGQIGCLHLNHMDFNNDGWIDLYLMRGAWYQQEGDIPSTLLMNTGEGKFIDVTLSAGLDRWAPSQASAWADVNLDGWLDLVRANESLPGFERGFDLYMNQGNGTFKNLAKESGLTANAFFKGITATDVNGDKYPDLYVTSLSSGNLLYINSPGNNGARTFVQGKTNIPMHLPARSFPAWSFDYNNDGREDIFVSGYDNEISPIAYWIESKREQKQSEFMPLIYENQGQGQFASRGLDIGLDEVAFTMGCNFGDINTDGYLDFYLATGNPAYQSLVPNKMYLNVEGRRFEDVSYSGGFANIQKGHGVGFGDADHDGDEDMYVVIGGAYEGDYFYNCFFENPNSDKNNWLILDLEGTTANRRAIGAIVKVTVTENGAERAIWRKVTSGSSFGGNSLILEIGLGKATDVLSVDIQWPCLECPDQRMTGFAVNRAYHIKQDDPQPNELEYKAVTYKASTGQGGHQHHQHH